MLCRPSRLFDHKSKHKGRVHRWERNCTATEFAAEIWHGIDVEVGHVHNLQVQCECMGDQARDEREGRVQNILITPYRITLGVEEECSECVRTPT